MSLPAALGPALARLTAAQPLAGIQAASDRLTAQYRDGHDSSAAVAGQMGALAYAAARMPATYAAIEEVLARLSGAMPDFAPQMLADVGAGPGTASFAAVERWPQLAAITMVEPHPHLAALAGELAAAHPHPAFRAMQVLNRRADGAALPEADLVVAAYVGVEQPEAQLAGFADRLVAATRQVLVLVEPGTPEGYRRLMLMRSRAIAAGLHVIAPCPHDGPCPLLNPAQPAGDWCHFSVRVQRSRLHRQAKQAEMGHEDEKFAYVVLGHAVPAERPARILAPPITTKIVTTLKLCGAEGVSLKPVPTRDKAASRAIRRLGWGDALPD